MKDKDLQNQLTYITRIKVTALQLNKIRGVKAIWKDETAYLFFYFSEQPTENELEDIGDMCTEIIAQMPKGMLEDKYFILETSYPLSEKFLAYKRKEELFRKIN